MTKAAFILTLSIFLTANAQDTPITSADADAASRLIGLSFTTAERDSMLDGLRGLLKSYQHMREVPLPNHVPPALAFNPLPHGFRFDARPSLFNASAVDAGDRPENLEDLAFASVGRLAALMKARKVTSVELTQMYLSRLRTYGPKLECVVTLTEDVALEQARAADREIAAGKYRGPLHGIPYGVKDLLATGGIRTTWGSAVYKDSIPTEDATVVKRLREAGAVLVAKLTLGELAWGDVWYGGMTRNPWNYEQGSNGSSAGSASATAAGLVAFSIGSETWGSIVSPSTVCGTTGLRPTFGRVSRMGAMTLSWSMDKLGPICRTVEDCALVLNAMYGPDGADMSVYNAPFRYDAAIDPATLRIGYVKSEFDSLKEGREHALAALDRLKQLGFNVVPVELPTKNIGSLALILSAEAGAAFDEFLRTRKTDVMVRQIKDAWPNEFRLSRFIPAIEYLQANRQRGLIIERMATIMDTIDCFVAPPFGDNLLLTNLTGHPCVVLPSGLSSEGLPESITITGRLFDEGTILAVAKAYQDATGFHLRHPDLRK